MTKTVIVDPLTSEIYPDKSCEVDHFQIIKPTIDYKFNEDTLLEELAQYIDATYQQHYAGDTYQATDIIVDAGHGIGFTLGNVIKYAKRYGKKEGYNRKDLLKMIHYSLLALYVHDRNENRAKEVE